jgi:lysozyme
MRVDFDVAMEVAAHEALIRQTYKDSKGVLTWCVGMTNATGHRVERYIGKPQPLQHCMNLFVWALTSYAEQVRRAFKDRPLTQAQFAAAVSFHWNTGAIGKASWVRHWLKGEDALARAAFMNWVTPPEIEERREKERDLFFDGEWSNDGTMLEFTKVRPSMAPDWSSGRRINVAEELRIAFGGSPDVVLDQAPDPDAVPAAPTLSPASVPTPKYRREPEEPMSAPIGHNGGPPLNPDLSPVDQTNKANKSAGGAVLGAGGIGGGIVFLWSLTPYFPVEWAGNPQAMIVLTGLFGSIFAGVSAWIGAYRATDRRFMDEPS